MGQETSAWIVAICSVIFDLDIGQKVEDVYPEHAISQAEASAVAFHAFPVSSYQHQITVELKLEVPSTIFNNT